MQLPSLHKLSAARAALTLSLLCRPKAEPHMHFATPGSHTQASSPSGAALKGPGPLDPHENAGSSYPAAVRPEAAEIDHEEQQQQQQSRSSPSNLGDPDEEDPESESMSRQQLGHRRRVSGNPFQEPHAPHPEPGMQQHSRDQAPHGPEHWQEAEPHLGQQSPPTRPHSAPRDSHAEVMAWLEEQKAALASQQKQLLTLHSELSLHQEVVHSREQ